MFGETFRKVRLLKRGSDDYTAQIIRFSFMCNFRNEEEKKRDGIAASLVFVEIGDHKEFAIFWDLLSSMSTVSIKAFLDASSICQFCDFLFMIEKMLQQKTFFDHNSEMLDEIVALCRERNVELARQRI
ncbi:MAG: hypothetical protein US25_C0009G0012 [Candidatus Moranbacteria bacterium GW2011_GWE1_36_7]|nr:MAG: hypothetical protein UR99_C0032G0001 [Candidatus Moranbacteria bacterium GW2011_GWD2_36_12]KKQ06655.1 MAG: hypothetical protein US16_C0012G0015 [Candidatus Moranbacteria bacterium GW2011_GWE2_36_40]KKQ15203.1 MAG: hypothetical protein US25_C0009G0012 [Candidatus Moranbacteria bacterium GW2011_GWE1_36_7]